MRKNALMFDIHKKPDDKRIKTLGSVLSSIASSVAENKLNDHFTRNAKVHNELTVYLIISVD